ncbi:DNA primase, catalytic core [Salinimicrobium catena]|uniref:DNA primase n=1 Tax=Salinimicrobium catena TaxID=390640 RepID=A0A1H5P5Z1_9FLAO|nr:DNA primase [Salinimicrobium catena]SDL72048.1 DNA primase, catalytic core [Salinimicrobium catena]SEF09014.1 DNA primase, catalytic core [Salinimicrobium catena]
MNYIKKENIEKITESSDLLEIISEFVDLKKQGANYVGLSPFTNEKTPSFTVSPSKGIWKDYSSDKGGNNPVSFLMEMKNLSYPEAIEWLARKSGIPLEYDTENVREEIIQEKHKLQELYSLLESVIKEYEKAFWNLPEDHPAKLEIFDKRKYSPEVVRKYRIGYAPGGKYIYDKCVSSGRKHDGIELGIINENYDKYSNRVIFPLLDSKGFNAFPIGLAGRKLDDHSKYPKWINSKESAVYKKNSFWYGLSTARESITKSGEVWLVEGYNDVIAWQENGIRNTIASCGTSISARQIAVLKKLCEKIVFCFDPDSAGRKAMLKYVPEFIQNGFRVQVVFLSPALDPDEFVRFWSSSVKKYGLKELGVNSQYRDDGFKFLMEECFKGKDSVDVAKETKVLAEIIAKIEDDAMREIYTDWLSKESGVKLPQVRGFIKNHEAKNKTTLLTKDEGLYRLPSVVSAPLEELLPTIEKYQLFTANKQVWIQQKGEPPYSFRSVSNFHIEIIQHMQDEKFPMKLVRLKNVHGLERIFDMQSSDINSLTTFENAVTAHGNFRWKGNRADHELLKTYLFDNMGTGRKIEVLGWQPEGFWVWNNLVSCPSQSSITIDENGVFEKENVSFYVPSANNIYRSNLYKYEAQKKVLSLKAPVTFQNFTSQVIKVHREHGMMGILFSIASIFQDIVVAELNMFPMLFLYGPASSGKDQLADVCQSFFGHPQTAINLEGGVSTIKAQVREFAQFSNTISHLSEYKNGDAKLDGVLKGLWDRRGYKRGNIDSHVGTDSIPILSSVLMTGNYAPDQEALITRFIWEFMEKTVFSNEETEEYEKLNDMTKSGISSFTDHFLQHRLLVEKSFKQNFRLFHMSLKEIKPEANSRMLSNLSVLGAFYQIFKDLIPFTFSHEEMMTHFGKTIDKQMNKMDSASIINRWWDCFLASMRGSHSDQLKEGQDFKLTGNQLYFNFTNCYNRVSRQWFIQYRDNAPAKGVMIDSLKKDKAWIDAISSVRLAPGRESRNTSAYLVDINAISVKDEIKFAIDHQRKENNLFGNPFSDEEPRENKKDDEELDDLPF